jgi:polyferredoxin
MTPPTDRASRPTGAPPAMERVLSTLNVDGSRRWLRPQPSHGRFLSRRRAVAYALMVVFFLIPYLWIAGKPVLLLDLPRREFTLLGTTFLSTETVFFQLLFLSVVIALFLFTALFGRVWCGWACPQTVYMEFLFRPVERALEGGFHGSLAMDQGTRRRTMRWVKYGVYLVLAAFLAHTFLGYFVRVGELVQRLLVGLR